MDQNEFILENLEIDKNKFGRIYSFVDFGNVNYWFENYARSFEGRPLKEREKLIVEIEKLGSFCDLFSEKKLFYYGIDKQRPASLYIQKKAKKLARFKVISKEIQYIKHYLEKNDNFDNNFIKRDNRGNFIFIPKCNFDVELAVDAIHLSELYDTFVLFSSDSDFARLLGYLKTKGKKVILFYSGHTSKNILSQADLLINASRIREIICIKKYPG
ncbi:NYN domain-containing protein [Patescibacteria group bacterium]|nr:NYN domain-containing protein [Patescibacteria group bacterium]